MSQISGALTLEVDLDRLAERIAARVVELLNESPGSDTYEREPEPATRWRGVRYGAVTDHGEVPL